MHLLRSPLAAMVARPNDPQASIEVLQAIGMLAVLTAATWLTATGRIAG